MVLIQLITHFPYFNLLPLEITRQPVYLGDDLLHRPSMHSHPLSDCFQMLFCALPFQENTLEISENFVFNTYIKLRIIIHILYWKIKTWESKQHTLCHTGCVEQI